MKEFSKEFDKSEEDLKSLQSGVGQIVGEVLRQLTEDKCEWVWSPLDLLALAYAVCLEQLS